MALGRLPFARGGAAPRGCRLIGRTAQVRSGSGFRSRKVRRAVSVRSSPPASHGYGAPYL